ncbi:MAG TPA: hypothetical protein ENK82_05890, partial [Campylobacterales bacterium]|nr:hypothetical protein [Campylobacterales bacterium]
MSMQVHALLMVGHLVLEQKWVSLRTNSMLEVQWVSMNSQRISLKSMVMVKHAKEILRYFFLFIFFSTLPTLLMAKKLPSVMTPVIFEGNQAISSSELEEMIGVEKAPVYLFWKDHTPKVDARLRSKLNETFRLFYQSEGFYEANISHRMTSKGLFVSIKENRPIVIKEISVSSDLDLSEEINLEEGSRFRAKDFSEMKRNIKAKLQNLGYCSPKLSTKAYLSLEEYAARIVVKLEKKRLCHF